MDELRTGREREEEKWESRGREVEELETELSKADESVEFAAAEEESKRVSVVVISSPPWDKSSKSSTKKSTASIYNISLLSLC